MKKLTLILVSLFTINVAIAQNDSLQLKERTFNVFNGKTTFAPYLGFVSHTNVEIESLAYPSTYSTRIGFQTNSEIIKNLNFGFDAMQVFDNNGSWNFSKISLKYSWNKFCIEAGKTASAATLFRPYPISWGGQFEFLAESYIPGASLFTGKVGFTSRNFGATFSIAERGNYLVGDSTEYALKIDIYNNSFGAYLLDGDLGVMYRYSSKSFYQLFYWRQDILTSATCLDIPKDFQLAIDFAWNYSDGFNKDDYIGFFVIKKLKIEYNQKLINGRIVVGYDNQNILSFHLGVFI